MVERISGAEDNIETIDKTVREDAKTKKLLTKNVEEIQDTMRRPNLWIIGIETYKQTQRKKPHGHLTRY